MNTHQVLVLLGIMSVCGAQKWKQDTSQWNPKGPYVVLYIHVS